MSKVNLVVFLPTSSPRTSKEQAINTPPNLLISISASLSQATRKTRIAEASEDLANHELVQESFLGSDSHGFHHLPHEFPASCRSKASWGGAAAEGSCQFHLPGPAAGPCDAFGAIRLP
ncbi:hypothetical protein B296_00013155 [Ensete ventricosum]|uniref:Uncharacterized protein n=1 Tax=Ensete ventricosum TaxID=4639 RepID=A0A427B1U5_ENSVE|nr:hypothetical protein B296_00013155 [Ensete ventricosum]